MAIPSDAAAAAALAAEAAAAFQAMTIEIWTLYGVALATTILRTYARIRAVGIKGLRWDDYLVWVGVVFYACQSALGYSIGNVAQGLANNYMTDEERAALLPGEKEYSLRIIGSQIQVAGWTVYSVLIWALKLSMLAFYIRLTEGLGRPYRIRINIGFALVLGTFIAAMLAIFIGCRPFHQYWQIHPNPGTAVSRPIIWVSFAANVSTDIYLIVIPMPMLWGSTLRTPKKIASTIVLGAGIFVLVCATLKSVFVIVDPVNGAQLAGSWGIREAFTAVMVTNLPMIFPLFKTWLRPYFASALRSGSNRPYNFNSSHGVRTIGGGYYKGNGSVSRDRHSGKDSHAISGNMTFNESEERIVDGINLQDVQITAARVPSQDGRAKSGIMVSSQFRVTHGNNDEAEERR